MRVFEFDRTFELFETYHRARNSAPATIDFYRKELRVFRSWLDARGLEFPDWLEVEVIEAFLAEQVQLYKPRTAHARYRALSAFLNWCERRNHLAGLRNPIPHISAPRLPRSMPRRTALSDYRALLSSIPMDRWLDARDRALVVLLFQCGLRVGEAADLLAADVDLTSRLVFVRAGKEDKDRYVPFGSDLAISMAAYLLNRPAYAGPELWLSDDGSNGVKGALSSSGIRQMLKRRCKRAGLRVLNPHSFRHGFAVELVNAGLRMETLSKIMGHSDTRTTEKFYAEIAMDAIAAEYNAALARVKGLSQ